MRALVSSDLNLEMKKGNKKNKYLKPDFTSLKLDSTILIFLPLKTLLRSLLDIILIKVKHLSKSNCLFKTVKTLCIYQSQTVYLKQLELFLHHHTCLANQQLIFFSFFDLIKNKAKTKVRAKMKEPSCL